MSDEARQEAAERAAAAGEVGVQPPIAAVAQPTPVPVVAVEVEEEESFSDKAWDVLRIIKWVLIGIGVFLIALILLRNTEDVTVDFIFKSYDVPLIGVIGVSLLIGGLIGAGIYYAFSHRDRK